MKTARADGFLGMYRGGLIMHPWGRPGLGQMRTECTAQGPRPCGFREHFCPASSGGWRGGGRGGLGCQVILSHICFSQMFLGRDRGSYGKVWGGGEGVPVSTLRSLGAPVSVQAPLLSHCVMLEASGLPDPSASIQGCQGTSY